MAIIELPDSLRLTNSCLRTCLASVIEAARSLWDRQLLGHYTNHGLDHSERLVEILGRLLQEHSNLLNEYERFILLSAVYLHDIGMQAPTYAGLPKKTEYTLGELDIIREKHEESSAKMILNSISDGPEFDFGLKVVNECRYLSKFIAEIAKYHRKHNIEDLTDDSFSGKIIRLPLLAALIKFADALDCDFRRVNMDRLKRLDLPVESKYHWWSHHFVKSIHIQNGEISIYFRFPEKYKESIVVDAFTKRVYENVYKHFLEVYDVLDKNGIRLYREPKKTKPEYLPDSVLECVPDDLLNYIKEITTMQDKANELSRRTGTVWYVDGASYSDDEKFVKGLSKTLQLLKSERYNQALKELEGLRNLTLAPKERASVLNILSNCYLILGNLSKSQECLRDILQITERKDLREIYKEEILRLKAISLGNLGIVFTIKGELDKALKYYEEALKIHREVGYRQGEASDLGNIGNVFTIKGELDKALKYYEEALKIHREVGYRQGEANQLGNLGIVYSIKGEFDEALKYHEEALRIDREIGYRQGEASDLGNIGNVYSDKGEFDEALKYHEEALRIDREIGYREGEACGLGNIGNVYSIKGEFDEAFKYWDKALEIFLVAAPHSIKQIIKMITTAFLKVRKFEKVFEYYVNILSTSPSKEESNAVLYRLLLIIKDLIVVKEWEELAKINIACSLGIILDENLKQFFKTIHKYAVYRMTESKVDKKAFEIEKMKVNSSLKDMLEGLLEKNASEDAV